MNKIINYKTFKQAAVFAALSAFILIQNSSCYTVRLINYNGSKEPDISNNEEGYFRNSLVYTLDTTITANFGQDGYMLFDTTNVCSSGGIHSIEYRVTLGQTLLNAITIGKCKRIKVKYSCLLDEDEFE